MIFRGTNNTSNLQTTVLCSVQLPSFTGYQSVPSPRNTPVGNSIAVKCEEKEGELILSFEESGPGFSEKTFNTLFQPFTTSEEHIDNQKGLGLSIVKIITDFHEADIHISNRPEGGARVELRFSKKGDTVPVS